jgi:hypothetical protein
MRAALVYPPPPGSSWGVAIETGVRGECSAVATRMRVSRLRLCGEGQLHWRISMPCLDASNARKSLVCPVPSLASVFDGSARLRPLCVHS